MGLVYDGPTVMWRMQRLDGLTSHALIDAGPEGPCSSGSSTAVHLATVTSATGRARPLERSAAGAELVRGVAPHHRVGTRSSVLLPIARNVKKPSSDLVYHSAPDASRARPALPAPRRAPSSRRRRVTRRALGSCRLVPLSPHCAFRRVIGETPKQYTLRLRLESAAARLVACADPSSPSRSPRDHQSLSIHSRVPAPFRSDTASYRAAALRDASTEVRARHQALTDSTGPCVGLFHTTVYTSPRRVTMPTISNRTPRACRAAHSLRPLARGPSRARDGHRRGRRQGVSVRTEERVPIGRPSYYALSLDRSRSVRIQVCLPLAVPASGQGDVLAGALPAGPVAVAVHGGPYDQLSETYAALERWIETNGLRTAGAPWESYVTDPGEHPDPRRLAHRGLLAGGEVASP